jgi:hypothetical protein
MSARIASSMAKAGKRAKKAGNSAPYRRIVPFAPESER